MKNNCNASVFLSKKLFNSHGNRKANKKIYFMGPLIYVLPRAPKSLKTALRAYCKQMGRLGLPWSRENLACLSEQKNIFMFFKTTQIFHGTNGKGSFPVRYLVFPDLSCKASSPSKAKILLYHLRYFVVSDVSLKQTRSRVTYGSPISVVQVRCNCACSVYITLEVIHK